jgi:Glutathione S-transferase, N-terminal domain
LPSVAAIIGSMEAMMLELYHNNVSVCAQKVRIVLAEKDVPWTSHHLSLAMGEHLTPKFKAMNPRGVVPVLVHDGNTIVESSVICAYLDEVFPTPPLSPKTPLERATMRLWCKLPDDILHTACATVSFAISFGQQLKKLAGTGLEERLMKMPDPARRERQIGWHAIGIPWRMPKSRPTSSVPTGSGLPVFGKAGRASRIGLRVSRLARASRGSRTIHRPTMTTPGAMGSKVGHGSKS